MRKHIISFAIGAVLAGSAFADAIPSNTTSMPELALTQPQVESSIAAAGFKQVKELKFDDGVWKAEARGGDKKWIDVRVHPLTGKVFAEGKPSRLNKQEVGAKLSAAGYTKLEDTKYKDGLWHATAENAANKEVKLLVDPDDASVIAEQAE